jgi:hypothetical protein
MAPGATASLVRPADDRLASFGRCMRARIGGFWIRLADCFHPSVHDLAPEGSAATTEVLWRYCSKVLA